MTDSLAKQLEEVYWGGMVRQIHDYVDPSKVVKEKFGEEKWESIVDSVKRLSFKSPDGNFDNSKVVADVNEVWGILAKYHDPKFDTTQTLTFDNDDMIDSIIRSVMGGSSVQVESKSSPFVCVGRCKNGARVYLRVVSKSATSLNGWGNNLFPELQLRACCPLIKGKEMGFLQLDPPVHSAAIADCLENQGVPVFEGMTLREAIIKTLLESFDDFIALQQRKEKNEKKWYE